MLKWLSALALLLATLRLAPPNRPAACSSPATPPPARTAPSAPTHRLGTGPADLLDISWEVRNHAQSGRSARSFIDQGWLDGIARDLRKGDVLLIQFGHNDDKIEDPAATTSRCTLTRDG